jgi:peptidoglycan/xylan/chitin deacetylase (PgdA/CDA1 family)
MRDRAKSLLRRGFSALFHYAGYTQLRGRGVGAARILCYHDISDTSSSRFSVSVHAFEEQMRHLATHYVLMSMEDIVDSIIGGAPLPGGGVAVTIDDGYEGVYTHAFPVLKDYQIPATLFLPTAAIGDAQLRQASTAWAQSQFMGWREVCRMAGEGIRIGSHSRNHASLPSLDSIRIRDEVHQSKVIIEERTGLNVSGFAYPYGLPRDYRGIARYVCEAGYVWGVTGVHGSNSTRTDPYLLHRTKVERGDSLAVFDRLVRGAMDPWRAVDMPRW